MVSETVYRAYSTLIACVASTRIPVRTGRKIGGGWQCAWKWLESSNQSSLMISRLGSLKVGQVRLEVKAADDVADDLMPVLEKKLLRAGG